MRRTDAMRRILKKYKKTHNNKDVMRRRNVAVDCNSDYIYYMDVDQLLLPGDTQVCALPIISNIDGTTIIGIAVDHSYRNEEDSMYCMYMEYFDIPVPKEFQDQEY